MELKLINNLTKNTIYICGIEYKWMSSIFYSFDISLPEGVMDGEYTYQLINDEGKMVSTGLLQVGDYENSNNEYKETKKGYIVYGE